MKEVSWNERRKWVFFVKNWWLKCMLNKWLLWVDKMVDSSSAWPIDENDEKQMQWQ